MKLALSPEPTIRLKQVLWIYFGLLIFEGALRKWMLPSLDKPLLVIRDPVALYAYLLAWRLGCFPQNAFIRSTVALAFITGLLGIMAGHGSLYVAAFGLRTNYLHVPLLFVLPKAFTRDDVIDLGRVVLFLSIPMAVLVVLQFKSPQGSWLNIGGMATHYGTVRPAATFSFVIGTVSFFALVASFVCYGLLEKEKYPFRLLVGSACSLLAATACSGSRSAVAAIVVVLATTAGLVFLKGKITPRVIATFFLLGLCAASVDTTEFVQEGRKQLVRRFHDARGETSIAESMIGRFWKGLTNPIRAADQVPLLGYGLGIGTNAGAGLLTGKRQFLFAEGEWERLLIESGSLFGLVLIGFRIALSLFLLRYSLNESREGNYLPLLLFGACGLTVLNGQWGQPTSLGFAVFGGGLCLAAGRVSDHALVTRPERIAATMNQAQDSGDVDRSLRGNSYQKPTTRPPARQRFHDYPAKGD